MNAPKDRKKLTIGFFAPYSAYGGTEKYLDNLIRPVTEMVQRVIFFYPADAPADWVDQVSKWAETVPYAVPSDNGAGEGAEEERSTLWDIVRRLHRRITPFSIRYVLWFVREALRLRRLFKQWPVDVLHAPDLGVEPFILGAKLARIPRLTGALNCLPRAERFRGGLTYRLLEMICLSNVDAIAAVSKNGKELWVKHARINPKKVRVIYNGVETAGFDRAGEVAVEIRKEFGIPLDARVIGVSAGLVPVKGHEYLLDALPDVLRPVPDAWLMLAGEGSMRDDLVRRAAALGIRDRVKFLGHRNDVMRIIHAYDVIALTSLSESMPFSLLEGMSCGKPVVASAVGGVPELVDDGVTGYLVPPGDSGAIANALILALRDREKTARMGRAALERVRCLFSVEKMVRETVELMLGDARPGHTVSGRVDGDAYARLSSR